MYGFDILCGISEVPFEIPHKISYPYIDRCIFYSGVQASELSDLSARERFWNDPRSTLGMETGLQVHLIDETWYSLTPSFDHSRAFDIMHRHRRTFN